ncbi:MAG: AAA family ATPase [Bacillota bacterium]
MTIPQNHREIKKALEILHAPGQVVEVRILDGGKGPISGYFSDWDKLTDAVKSYDGRANIYITLNPVHGALLARANNRLAVKPKNTTSDSDVITRRWFLIDLDPVRPSGICANEEEKQMALERARQVYTYLKESGWPDPVVCDSGNGLYLLYPVNLPNDGASRDLLQNCLQALALRFDDETVSIDTSVYNAARIIRLIGTVNCKGDNTPDRPHRMSKLLRVPENLEPIPVDKLSDLAALAPKPEPRPFTSSGQNFDLGQWITERGLPVVASGPWQAGVRWILNPCPMEPSHTNRSAYIVRFADGRIGAGCHHNSCQWWGWRELRERFEPGCYDKQPKDKPGREAGDEPTNEKKNDNAPRPAVVALANVQPEEAEWLWRPYLPRRKLTILEGDPGIGKTWVALAVCARLTAEGHPVLYATAEDGIADTLRVRVGGMDADLSRFFILRGQESNGLIAPVTLADPDVLRAAVMQYSPALVVLDPIQAFLGADVDAHRANETRPRLAYLSRLAEDCGCGVLIIRHLGKAPAGRAIYRGLGSIDFAAAARSVLLAGKTQDEQLAIVQIKNSLGEVGPALGFEIKAGQFFWTGEANISAGDILQPEAAQEERSALEEACEWLQSILAGGPVDAKQIRKLAREAGLIDRSDILLRRAKQKLSVKAEKVGEVIPGEGWKIKGWVWYLPGNSQGAHQDDHPLKNTNEHLGSVPANPEKSSTPPRCSLTLPMSILEKPSNDKAFRAKSQDAHFVPLESEHQGAHFEHLGGWSQAEADKLIDEAAARQSEILNAEALRWSKNGGAEYRTALDEAEATVTAAYQNQDMAALRNAVAKWKAAAEDLAAAYRQEEGGEL